MKTALIVAMIWIGCGIITSGMWCADFSYNYPGTSSVRKLIAGSMFPALGGPIGLFAIGIVTGFAEHGLCWTEVGCSKLRKEK